jgi:hypothetical protein
MVRGFKIPGAKRKIDVEEYEELDLGEYESALEEPAEMYIKVAELTKLDDIPDMRKEVYDGNVVLIDISSMKKDKTLIDRSVKELRRATADVKGDIVGLGEDWLIATPTSVKVDRKKISGEY